MRILRFFQDEAGGAPSSMIFAAAMGVTAFAMIAAYTTHGQNNAQALNDLSGTQYLSSQKLR